MPLLRELDLQAPFDYVPAFPAAFYEVPRLRVATLGFPLLHHPVTVVATDFALTLRAKLPSQCTPVLEQTVNLVYCELVLLNYDALPEPDIHLPHLESLILMLKYFLRRIPWANCPHFSQNPGAI
jgi:hypothetical protein